MFGIYNKNESIVTYNIPMQFSPFFVSLGSKMSLHSMIINEIFTTKKKTSSRNKASSTLREMA